MKIYVVVEKHRDYDLGDELVRIYEICATEDRAREKLKEASGKGLRNVDYFEYTLK